MEVLESSLCGLPLLKVTGEVDHSAAPALEDSVQRGLRVNDMRLFVDFTDCSYLDSSGLSVLLCAVREVRGKGWVGAIAPGPNLLRLFELVGLTSVADFHVFSGSEEAEAALEG